jgi:hypothetical protein
MNYLASARLGGPGLTIIIDEALESLAIHNHFARNNYTALELALNSQFDVMYRLVGIAIVGA